jgi:hypothetical protein
MGRESTRRVVSFFPENEHWGHVAQVAPSFTGCSQRRQAHPAKTTREIGQRDHSQLSKRGRTKKDGGSITSEISDLKLENGLKNVLALHEHKGNLYVDLPFAREPRLVALAFIDEAR